MRRKMKHEALKKVLAWAIILTCVAIGIAGVWALGGWEFILSAFIIIGGILSIAWATCTLID
jgi:hypothetical protein